MLSGGKAVFDRKSAKVLYTASRVKVEEKNEKIISSIFKLRLNRKFT